MKIQSVEETERKPEKKPIKKTCSICGKEFETISPRKKYCSVECKKVGAVQSTQRWRERHPERIQQYKQHKAAYMRRKRARKKAFDEAVKEDRLAKIAVEYNTKYGDYQREKLLTESHIDVEAIIASFNVNEKGASRKS